MVIAPHPDDEVLGCGYRLWAAGRGHVITVTDGRPPVSAPIGGAGDQDRYNECHIAWQSLGFQAIMHHTLGYRDQQVAQVVRTLADDLRRVFIETEPTRILCPALQHGHPDHDAVFIATYLALSEWRTVARSPSEVEVYGLYSVKECHEQLLTLDEGVYATATSPVPPAGAMSAKVQAMRMFRSQYRVSALSETVVGRWLLNPVPEWYAPWPHVNPLDLMDAIRPEFHYEVIMDFGRRYGLYGRDVVASLRASLKGF